MKPTFFLTAILLLISCHSKINKTEEIIDKPNINRVWKLVEFQKFSIETLIQKKASLDMSKHKVATASMGCNGISTNYEIKLNSEITFSEGMRTQMACEEMKLEDDFLRILPKMNNYKISGHQLTLSNKEGDKMVFIAQDWD
jgi:heat shock protein HslJ